jgi:hypothetical protein
LFCQHDSDYEVLVSNDDDPERYLETKAVCDDFEKQGMPIRHFYTGQYKRGLGWSVETYPYNVGIRNATGELILFNSGDTMSVTNTIDQHRQWHKSNKNVALVSTVHALGQTVFYALDTYPWKTDPMSLLFKGSCVTMYSGCGRCYSKEWDHAEAHNPYHFLMSVPKQVLWDIHGFDEDYFGQMSCGDDDLAGRLIKYGLTFHYAEHILAIHLPHGSPQTLTKENRVADRNENFDSGHTLYTKRKDLGIVRNENHEWGQFPRDTEHLSTGIS